jgi:hypothetical protein
METQLASSSQSQALGTDAVVDAAADDDKDADTDADSTAVSPFAVKVDCATRVVVEVETNVEAALELMGAKAFTSLFHSKDVDRIARVF